MRLKNKKTGELGTLTLSSDGETFILMNERMYTHSVKLKDLEEWEDYEEPKRHWIIDTMNDRVEDFDVPMTFNESIGNYFDTKEEAEKALEKLKAFKRLKDNGMRKYSFHKEKTGIDLDFYTLTILAPRDKDSLDLLFGGKE